MAGLPPVSLLASPVSSELAWASAFSRNRFAFMVAGEHGMAVAVSDLVRPLTLRRSGTQFSILQASAQAVSVVPLARGTTGPPPMPCTAMHGSARGVRERERVDVSGC